MTSLPKRFRAVARDLGELLVAKNRAYGDSFFQSGAFLRLLWPAGVPPNAYDDMLMIVRIYDKLKRIAAGAARTGEEDPALDIAGYAILGHVRNSLSIPPRDKPRARRRKGD